VSHQRSEYKYYIYILFQTQNKANNKNKLNPNYKITDDYTSSLLLLFDSKVPGSTTDIYPSALIL